MTLPRVLSLLGGYGLLAAFFMPWFSTQNLLLSGQFLHTFLADPGDLRRFVPGSSGDPTEVQLLRALVDLFPVCGALAMLTTFGASLAPRWSVPADILLVPSGLVPLLAWAVGMSRLPPGASPQVGLWLIVLSAMAVLLGMLLEVLRRRHVRAAAA